jgi:uncharacterized membrane protein YgcG
VIHRLRIAPAARSLVIVGLLVALSVLSPRGALALDLPPSQEGVYVYDLADVFSPGAIAKAQTIAAGIKARTGAEMAIVSWPSDLGSISPATAIADGRTIMDTWGVGRAGVNDGIVVLFDMDTSLRSGGRHGQVTIVTGAGFRDQYLSEGEAKTIIDEAMVPPAKAGDMSGALTAGLERIDAAVVPGGNPAHGQAAVLQLLAALVVGGGAIALLAAFALTWWRRGRDGAIPLIDDSVLLPAPPPGLTPALATVLRKDTVDADAFTTGLLDLGHRGLIVFRQTPADPKKLDFVLPSTPLDDSASVDARKRPLGDAEATLLESARSAAAGAELVARTWGLSTQVPPAAGDEPVLTNERLKGGIGAQLSGAFRKGLGRAAKASPWFRDDPTRLVNRWHAVGLVTVVAAFVIGGIAVSEKGVSGDSTVRPHSEPLIAAFVGLFVVGVVMLLSSRFLAARTAEGGQVLAMALAYRNTLRHVIAGAPGIDEAMADAQPRLPWIGTPDELAVWGTALGLHQEIDDLFKRSLQDSGRTSSGWAPVWYAGSLGSVADFGSVIASIGTTSTSSSGSGYGGGGSGGGGGSSGGF